MCACQYSHGYKITLQFGVKNTITREKCLKNVLKRPQFIFQIFLSPFWDWLIRVSAKVQFFWQFIGTIGPSAPKNGIAATQSGSLVPATSQKKFDLGRSLKIGQTKKINMINWRLLCVSVIRGSYANILRMQSIGFYLMKGLPLCSL